MAFTRFATSEPWDPASGPRLNKLGDELQEQINVLNNERGYLDTVNLPTNTDFNTILENGKYAVNTNVNSPITANQWTYDLDVINYKNTSGVIIRCVQIATLINTSYKTYKRVLNGGVWTQWEEIATTTKTSFLCTANSGYKIDRQNCYKINDTSYIRLTISKADGGTFNVGSHITVATLPFSSGNTSLSFAGAAGGFWSSIGSAMISGAYLVATINTSNTTQIVISGVI